jgi:hypothetical protein
LEGGGVTVVVGVVVVLVVVVVSVVVVLGTVVVEAVVVTGVVVVLGPVVVAVVVVVVVAAGTEVEGEVTGGVFVVGVTFDELQPRRKDNASRIARQIDAYLIVPSSCLPGANPWRT